MAAGEFYFHNSSKTFRYRDSQNRLRVLDASNVSHSSYNSSTGKSFAAGELAFFSMQGMAGTGLGLRQSGTIYFVVGSSTTNASHANNSLWVQGNYLYYKVGNSTYRLQGTLA